MPVYEIPILLIDRVTREITSRQHMLPQGIKYLQYRDSEQSRLLPRLFLGHVSNNHQALHLA